MAGGRAVIIPSMVSDWLDQDNLSVPMLSAVLNAGATGMILYEAECTGQPHYAAIEKLKRMDLFGHTTDLNADGFVDINDFAIFASRWLDNNCFAPYCCNGADIVPNQDGRVDIQDFTIFLDNWLTELQF